MAMGTQPNNNQNQKGLFEPSYYPRLRFKTADGRYTLSPTFWKGSLKLSITERNGENNEEIGYIHLSPMKASTMAYYAQKIIDDEETFDIYGVDTGTGENRGLIAVGREMGKPYVFIAKVDANGSYLSSFKFMFNVDYHYGLQINDLDRLSFQKEYFNNAELIQFKQLLEDYARSSNGAYAFSVHDIARYETAKSQNFLRQIAEKVGVELKGSNGSRYTGSSNNSFFSGNNSSSGYDSSSNGGRSSSKFVGTSPDDLENEFMGE